MSFTYAIIIIVLLLLFDAVFLGLLRSRRRRVVFSFLIEEGIITHYEGDIPAEFLFDVEQLSRMYKPGNIKITGKRLRQSIVLDFSGPMPEELKEKYRNALAVSLKRET